MRHFVVTTLLILTMVSVSGEDGRNPADDASERTPPSVVCGKTYDKGPMIWTWDTIKGIFGREKK